MSIIKKKAIYLFNVAPYFLPLLLDMQRHPSGGLYEDGAPSGIYIFKK